MKTTRPLLEYRAEIAKQRFENKIAKALYQHARANLFERLGHHRSHGERPLRSGNFIKPSGNVSLAQCWQFLCAGDQALNSNDLQKPLVWKRRRRRPADSARLNPVGFGRQRAVPVVVAEGPSAGGGVLSTAVDPGVPLGPGLLATCVVFHGPHVRMASARTNPTMMPASVLPPIEPFLS